MSVQQFGNHRLAVHGPAVNAGDDADMRAIDNAGYRERAMCALWPAVLVARLLALALVLSIEGVGYSAVLTPATGVLVLALALDIGIILAVRKKALRRFFARQPRWLLPAVLLAGAAGYGFGLTALTLAADGAAMLTGIMAGLGTLLVALSVLVPHRHLIFAFSMSLLFGIGLAATSLTVLLGSVVFLPLMLLVAIRRAATDRQEAAIRERAYARGERARMILTDYERSGRGWFWETDRHGRISYITPQAVQAIGLMMQDVLGQQLSRMIVSGGDHAAPGERTVNFHFSARTAFSDLAVRVAASDEERWWSLSGSPYFNSLGQFQGFQGHGTDLTEVRRSHAAVTQLARYDNLTGLANRLYIKELFEKALTTHRGDPAPCALFLLDLDRFKQVNDTLGHPIGDALLKQVSERLKRAVGDLGEVGRLGGDEFQVVLPGIINTDRLGDLARAIIAALSHPYMVEGNQIVIGASVGIAIAEGIVAESAETLIRNADLALYAAKEGGRGICRFYDEGMHKSARERRALESDLRNALATGGLSLAYQPVVNVASERISGFETLARWDHPILGEISPKQFIPVAEDAGLIVQLGEWVLRTACATAAAWPGDVRVAVNVSPIQFADPGFPTLVINSLAQSGLDPRRLELEITESVFLDGRQDADRIFERLKAIGVRLALDDFGTGYSALGYLRKAPFDKIKIDQSFVRGAAKPGSPNSAIVRAIVSLAEALNMETTAEGAETLDELELIRTLGCSHVQGFVYGRPMPNDEVKKRLIAEQGTVVASGHQTSREPRYKVLRTVGIHHDGYCYPCRIKNISTGGAMVEGLWDVPLGTQFEVSLASNMKVRATARWSIEDRMGLQFELPISLEKFRQSIPPQIITGYDGDRMAG